ncbi:MAG: HAD family hydrolase [Proteobacteria bacterium SG_bin5]|nr:MAG: HAD family hydrolase [Proteobacteria bacterium SG_bin5]
MPSLQLICLDADDTLWHNMRHFEATEAALADLLAPFAEHRVARATLAEVETRNLALYGYGAKSFTLSMIETALELCGDALTAAELRAILEAGRALLAHPVELFDGIAETIEALAEIAPLVLVTKGDLLHQESKLAASGLGAHFTGVEIVSEKDAGVFTRLFAKYGVAPEAALMAGDSMRSDVLPALAAGAWGIYVPHSIVWSHERAPAPSDHPRFAQLDRLGDLPGWIASQGLDQPRPATV